MEKQVVFTSLKAKLNSNSQALKNYSISLFYGESEVKTKPIEGIIDSDNGGTSLSWEESFSFRVNDEKCMKVRLHQEDEQSVLFGYGKLIDFDLKENGTLKFQILLQSEVKGQATLEYVVRNPSLTLSNMKCCFYRGSKSIQEKKPFLKIKCQNQIATQPLEPNELDLSSAHQLKLNIKPNQSIQFSLVGEDEQTIFQYETSTEEFQAEEGMKAFHVVDKCYQPLGVLYLSFSTANFVNRELLSEEMKSQNEINQILIQQIKGQLKDSGEDIYFKINIGPNMIRTQYIENASQNFTFELDKKVYAQLQEAKIIFAAFDKDLINDDVLGWGYLPLKQLSSGEHSIALHRQGKNIGQIIVILQVQRVKAKILKMRDIKVKLLKSGDIFGASQPFVIAKVGEWSARTQTGNGQEVVFDRELQLKFSDEKQMLIEVWEEDVGANDLISTQVVKFQQLTNNGEITIPLKSNKNNQQGSVSFKYESNQAFQRPKSIKQGSTKRVSLRRSETPERKVSRMSQRRSETPQRKASSLQKKSSFHENQKKTGPQEMLLTPLKKQQMENKQNMQTFHENSSIEGRNNFRFPSIVDSQNFGDKIFEKQSAATLQKSIHVYSIPKAPRFKSSQKYIGEPSYYMDTCFKPNSRKGVGFGFGNKRQFPEWMQRNMKENPAPGAYTYYHNCQDEPKTKGPTFGISYRYYSKVTIPKERNTRSMLKPLHMR